MSTAVQVETCPRCGIQKPFYCACDQTVDAEGGFSIFVNGLGVVHATAPDKTPKPTEYFVTLEGQHEFSKTEYRFKPEDAKRLAQLIIAQVEQLLEPEFGYCIHHEDEGEKPRMVNIADTKADPQAVTLRCPECGWIPVEVAS